MLFRSDDENIINNHYDSSFELCHISCIPNGIQRFCIRGLGSVSLLKKVLKINENSKYMNDKNENKTENEIEISSSNNANNNEGNSFNNDLPHRYKDEEMKNKFFAEDEDSCKSPRFLTIFSLS